ncbi:MAG: FMN-binding negative transcriptional regulator [Ferrovibrio sp.]
MYIPAHFAQADRDTLFDLIESHAFGLLVSGSGTAGAGGLIASHVPFLLDRPQPGGTTGEHGTLVCHLAAANDQVAALDGQEVLCIFQGPHGYVSPNWYTKKPAVPTWNYMVVHAYGRVRLTRDPAELRSIVDRLSLIYEGPDGWKLADEPEGYFAGMARGIVGIEIPVTKLEGKFKLSQNRPLGDVDGVIANLRRLGGADNLALADAMDAAARKKRDR